MVDNHLTTSSTIYRLLVFWILLCLIDVIRGDSRSPFIYQLPEGLPAGTIVGNISRDAALDGDYSWEELSHAQYTKGNNHNPMTRLFTVDRRHGVLRTNTELDRDESCRNEDLCSVAINVIVAFQEGDVTMYQVKVFIHDVNDNSPVFERESHSYNISENVEPGTEYVLPTAEDIDSSAFSVRKYELVPSSDQFTLKQYNTSDGLEARLKIIKPLDRERQATYQFRLIASDSLQNQHTGSMILNINVKDVNDNIPTFEREQYDLTIWENTPVGTSIGRVHALDEDVTSVIRYRLEDRTHREYGNVFFIDSELGDIIVNDVIDRERVESYVLDLQATDSETNPTSAFCRVLINVRDLNDNPPEIRVASLSGSDDISVPEESLRGSAVAHITATDPDLEQGGLVTCSLRDTQFFELQDLGDAEYTLKTSVIMDREDQSVYNVIVECFDHGDPVYSAVRHIVVHIEDINDHVPLIWSPSYEITINEGNPIGRYLMQVNATDPDFDRNGAVKYRFENLDNERLLNLNPITGVIRTSIPFDYEKESLLEFPIIAYDQAEVSQSSSTTLTLTIKDINDEAPVFVDDAYHFHVFEEQPPHTPVGTVRATDADSPPYNEISYSFVFTGADVSNFVIDERSGEIITTKKLDREAQAVYELLVKAANVDTVLMNNVVNVTIEIADQNDNTPIILFPNINNNTIYISPDLKVGHVITSIVAVDYDYGISGEFSFSTTYADDTFFINSTTGEVILQKNLTSLAGTFTDLMINVTDHGLPTRYAVTNLYIKVSEISYAGLQSDNGFVTFFQDNLIFLIIGIVLFVLLCVLFVVILTVCLRNRRHKEKQEKKKKYTNGSGIVLANKDSLKDCQDHQMHRKQPVEADEGLYKCVKLPDIGESCTDGGQWANKIEISAHQLALDHSRKYGGDATSWTRPDACDTSSYAGSSIVGMGRNRMHGDDDVSDNTSVPITIPNSYLKVSNNQPNHVTNQGHYQANPANNQGHYQEPRFYQSPPRSSPITSLAEMDMQVNEMLEILRQEQNDSENESYTDSGRGPSEEGDYNKFNFIDAVDKSGDHYIQPHFYDQRSKNGGQSRGLNKTKRKLLYPPQSPVLSSSTGSDVNPSSIQYTPEAIYDRLRSRMLVPPGGKVPLGDKLNGIRSTDAGKIHLNDSIGCTPISEQSFVQNDGGGGSYNNKNRPEVPVRISSFSSASDSTAAAPLKVHDHRPSGCHARSGSQMSNPDQGSVSSWNQARKNLPPLSRSALYASKLSQQDKEPSLHSPTSVSEDDTTTSGSYVIDCDTSRMQSPLSVYYPTRHQHQQQQPSPQHVPHSNILEQTQQPEVSIPTILENNV